ncbi:hypothetical protein KAI87_16140 [Myxococcota bacterium]|nr:hypothetical protein [Myxococcota bacterium]
MAQKEKEQKQEARKRLDTVKDAMAKGDYQSARALAADLAEFAPESEQGKAAALLRGNLGMDKFAIYAGLVSVFIYILAWGLSL